MDSWPSFDDVKKGAEQIREKAPGLVDAAKKAVTDAAKSSVGEQLLARGQDMKSRLEELDKDGHPKTLPGGLSPDKIAGFVGLTAAYVEKYRAFFDDVNNEWSLTGVPAEDITFSGATNAYNYQLVKINITDESDGLTVTSFDFSGSGENNTPMHSGGSEQVVWGGSSLPGSTYTIHFAFWNAVKEGETLQKSNVKSRTESEDTPVGGDNDYNDAQIFFNKPS